MTNHLPSIIEELLKDHFGSQIKINSVKSLGGGCINHAMQLKTSEGDFFVKWNNNPPEDIFLREAESLEELEKPKSSLIVPHVYAKTELSSDHPGVLITEFLSPSNSGSKNQDEILGRGLAEVHRFEKDKFGFYHDNYCGSTIQDNTWNSDWIDFFANQRIKHLLNLIKKSRGLETSEQKVYDQLIQKLPQLINHNPKPGLIHGDLWSGNYMYSAKGPAIIDPASCYADREFELSITNMFGGFSDAFWKAYQEAFPLPNDWQERNNLYMLYHYLNHYHLFGGYYGSQALQIAKKFI